MINYEYYDIVRVILHQSSFSCIETLTFFPYNNQCQPKIVGNHFEEKTERPIKFPTTSYNDQPRLF